MQYIVYAKCGNCGWEGKLEVCKGMMISSQKCPNCDCVTVSRAEQRFPKTPHLKDFKLDDGSNNIKLCDAVGKCAKCNQPISPKCAC